MTPGVSGQYSDHHVAGGVYGDGAADAASVGHECIFGDDKFLPDELCCYCICLAMYGCPM